MNTIHPSAEVEAGATVGEGTRIWHLAHVRSGATVGANCVIGRGVYVGAGVSVGERCKIQNNALVYEPAKLGDGVFVGPAVVLTNDQYPRAINADGTPKSADDWHAVGVEVDDGASIGAGAVCVAPVRIGRWATIASGAVVTKDVPDYGLVAGVPARRIGWVGPAGRPLRPAGDDQWTCPVTGQVFRETDGQLAPQE